MEYIPLHTLLMNHTHIYTCYVVTRSHKSVRPISTQIEEILDYYIYIFTLLRISIRL